MSSQHAQKTRAFRPEPDEYAAAKVVLDEHGRQMNAYLRACLRWLVSSPDAALSVLAAHWPDPRLTGRPPAEEDESARDGIRRGVGKKRPL